MDNATLIADDIKKKIIGSQDKLDKATEQLKADVEKDIEGEFSITEYDRFMNDRDSIIRGTAKSLAPLIEDAKEAWEEVEERESESQFKRHKENDTIDSDDYNQLRKTCIYYQRLYSNFALMWNADEKVIQKLRGAIDQQAAIKQTTDLTEKMNDLMSNQNDLGETIANSITSGTIQLQLEEEKEKIVDEVEERVGQGHEHVEDIRQENKELKSRVEDLTDRLNQLETTDEADEGQENTVKEKEELSPKQQELYDLVQDNPDKDEKWYLGQFEQSDNVVKSWATKIRNKGYQQFRLD